MANSLTDQRYRAMIDRLVKLRQDAGLSQRDVAERLGKVQNHVWKVEKYQQRLDPLQLIEWLRALEADERKFLLELPALMPASKRKR